MSSQPDIERTPEPCTTSRGYKDCIVYDVWIISSGCSQRWEMLHPPSHAGSSMQTTPNYVGDKGEVVQFTVRTFNYRNRPRNPNWVALFRLTYYKQYVQQGLRYQMQMTLADTNCKSESEWLNAACSFIPNAASVQYEIGVQSIPWAKAFKVTHSSWTRHNCTKPLIHVRPKNRDCTNQNPPIPMLVVVSNFLQGKVSP